MISSLRLSVSHRKVLVVLTIVTVCKVALDKVLAVTKRVHNTARSTGCRVLDCKVQGVIVCVLLCSVNGLDDKVGVGAPWLRWRNGNKSTYSAYMLVLVAQFSSTNHLGLPRR